MHDFYQKEQKLIADYGKLKPLLADWGNFLDKTVIEILGNNGFDLSRVQIMPKHRIKTDQSVIRRAFYRDIESSSDPLKRIEDKVGTRIVVTTLEDVKEIREIIMAQQRFWIPRESRGMEKHLAKPREFDYQSLHINLTPTCDVNGFENASKKERENYICELQVRTLLQHAFAEVAHDTIYKGVFGADSQLVRILSRSMALMEVTDEYFCRAFEIMKKEDTHEKNFVNRLITISKERLGIEFQAKQVDTELTDDLFNALDVRGVNIDEVERTLVVNKEIIEKTMSSTRSYLKTQPVIMLIIHMIFTNAYKLKEKWHLEDDILKELFYKLGHSTRK